VVSTPPPPHAITGAGGIASAEALGAPLVAEQPEFIYGGGTGRFGESTHATWPGPVMLPAYLYPEGIRSAEAFGRPKVATLRRRRARRDEEVLVLGRNL
jgi:hypothetical protein